MKAPLEELKKNKKAIYLAAFIVIISLDLLVILKAQIRLAASAASGIKTTKTELSRGRQEVASFNSLAKRYEALKKNKDLKAQQFIYEDEVLSLLGDISTLAQANSVNIKQIKPQKGSDLKEVASPAGKYYILPIAIEAQAGFHALARFLNKIESGQRFVKVLSLEINQSSADYLYHTIKLRLGALVGKR